MYQPQSQQSQPSCPIYEHIFTEVPIAEPVTEDPPTPTAITVTNHSSNSHEKRDRGMLYCPHCGHSWDSVSSQWHFNHVLSKQYSFVMGMSEMDEYKVLARDLRECEAKMNILHDEIAQLTAASASAVKPDPCAPVIIRQKTEEIARLEKTRKELNEDLAIYDDLDYETIKAKYNDYVKQAHMFAEKHKIKIYSPHPYMTLLKGDILADEKEFCELFTKRSKQFEDSSSAYIDSIGVYKHHLYDETSRTRFRTEMDDLRKELYCLLCHVPSTRHYLRTIVCFEYRLDTAVSEYNTFIERAIEINNNKSRCIIS